MRNEITVVMPFGNMFQTGITLILLSTTTSFFASAYQLRQHQSTSPNSITQNVDNKFSLDYFPTMKSGQTRQSQLFIHRREFFAIAVGCFGCLSIDRTGHNNIANAVDGVIRSKGCYQGTGDGCTELSESNPLILKLQQQSLLNRDRNEKEALYAYYMKNYPDFFNSIGQVMIKKSSDNTFVLVTPQEAERLKGLGQLSYEVPRTRGGTIVDYTQKPILVLKE